VTGGQSQEHDVLVVGGGAVGLAAAIRLARAGVRVLVLEAGPPTPPVDYQRHNHGASVGLPHRGLAGGRMRALGGTTRLWGGQLVPFGPEDFDGPTVHGPSPWPIRHADIAAYLDEAFRFLGVDAAATDFDAIWRRTTGQPRELASALRLRMNVWLSQPDFTQLFAADLAGLASLQVLTDRPVRRLRFAANGVVEGVDTERPDGTVEHHRATVVVLAAGTFETVKLLLRAAASAPSCGFRDNARIGKGYIDHLHGLAGAIRVRDPRRLGALFDNIYVGGRKYGVKMEMEPSFRSGSGVANCAGTINTPTTVGAMVRDLSGLLRRIVGRPGGAPLRTALRQAVTLGRLLLPLAIRYVWQRRSTSIMAHGVQLGLELEQIVTPNSHIELDPAVPPEEAEVRLHWGFDGREMDTAATFCAAAAKAFADAGLGTIEIDPRITARDPAYLLSCHDSNHQMGGARMAMTADEGVVDPSGRVFGAANLYVAGACTFPTGSFANPTLTAIAFALRLADHLSQQLRDDPAARSC
jgi:choline dehydrogenase-like flavoprotein